MSKKCYIKLKSFNSQTLERVCSSVLTELKKKYPNLSGSLSRLPTKIKKITLLKSPHIYKKSREQFEIRNYSRVLSLEGSQTSLENLIKTQIEQNKTSFYYTIKWQK